MTIPTTYADRFDREVVIEFRPHRSTTPPPPPAPDDWHDHAACVGRDPDLFFPERGEPASPAKAICAGCAVRSECLAENWYEKYGVFGGMSALERRQARSAAPGAARRRRGR